MNLKRPYWYGALIVLALMEITAYYAVTRLKLKPRDWLSIYGALVTVIFFTFVMSRIALEHPLPSQP